MNTPASQAQSAKLYLNDSLLLNFEAQVVGISSFEGQPSALLNVSAFYGEAGGQLGDMGTLVAGDREVGVVDCQYDAEGNLHHILENDTLQEGDQVEGYVEFNRRRDMMSQHTGQHLLSAAFDKMMDAPTVSSRLGSKVSTLDLDTQELSDAEIEEVVTRVNQLVLENRAVRPLYPTEEELLAMNLRRLPKVKTDIRIIEIEDFDFTPCGGTHCSTTGQIGPVHVIGRERYKGMVRLNFLCGERVLDRLKALEEERVEWGEQLGCGAAGVGESLVKMQKDLKEQQQKYSATRGALLKYECADLHQQYPAHESGTTPIILIRDGEDLDSLRSLGVALARRSDVVSLIASKDPKTGDYRIILDAGESSGFDAGGWFRGAGKVLGGRGGGRPQHAEGRFPSDLDPATISLSN